MYAKQSKKYEKLAFVAGMVVAANVYGQAWDFGAATNDWTAPTNWSTDAVPADNAAVTFGDFLNAPAALVVDVGIDTTRPLTGLTFSSLNSTYTLNNGTLQ